MNEAPLQPHKIGRKEQTKEKTAKTLNFHKPQPGRYFPSGALHLCCCALRKWGWSLKRRTSAMTNSSSDGAGTALKRPQPECSSLEWVLYQSIQCSVNWLVARANCILWRQRRAQHPLWLITNKYCNRNIWTVWYRDLQACSADTGFLRDFLALLTSRGYISVLDPVNVGCNVVAYALQFILFLANAFISNNKRYLIILYKW